MTVSITPVHLNLVPTADILLNSRLTVFVPPLLMAAGPVIHVINRSVRKAVMRPKLKTVTLVPLLLITAEPVTPAKTTLARPVTANPLAAAPIIRPDRPRLRPGQPVMPAPCTTTPAPTEHKLQAPE